ncbi:hypothetical protein TSOC_006073, partial [Tetrabaena socialis]
MKGPYVLGAAEAVWRRLRAEEALRHGHAAGKEAKALDSSIWSDLAVELQLRILGMLPPNYIAFSPSPPNEFHRKWGVPSATSALTYDKRKQLLCLIAASGSVANLMSAEEGAGLLLREEVVEAAAAAGQREVCRWLVRQVGVPWGNSLDAAAGTGRQAMCNWLLAQGCKGDFMSAAIAAARGGHVSLMDWLLALLPDHSQLQASEHWPLLQLLGAVAEGCDLATLIRMHQQLTLGGGGLQLQRQEGQQQANGGDAGKVVACAAGSLTPCWQAKVEWLLDLGYPAIPWNPFVPPGSTSGEARYCPDALLGRLAWLRQRGFPVGRGQYESAASEAARAGNMAVLNTMFPRDGQAWGPDVEADEDYWIMLGQDDSLPTSRAAAEGRVDVLELLSSRGFRMDRECMADLAAYRGHVNVLMWMEEKGFGRFIRTGHMAFVSVQSGSLETVTWLYEHGCPPRLPDVQRPQDIYEVAVPSGCVDMLEWLVTQGLAKVPGRAFWWACVHGDLNMLRCLVRLCLPWQPAGNDLTNVAGCTLCPPAMVPHLLEAGCPVDYEQALAAALRRGTTVGAKFHYLTDGNEVIAHL